MTPELAGNADVAVVIVLLALTVIFSIWAWKLWHGEWLNSIAGNTFATRDELKLPYQKRMAKEVAALLAVCDLLFVSLIACELASASERTFLLVALSFGVALIAGCAIVVARANKAAKREQVEAGLRKQGFPTKEADPEFGGGKKLIVIQWICVGVAGLLPTIVTFAAYFLGWLD